jgi:hypothetical protein
MARLLATGLEEQMEWRDSFLCYLLDTLRKGVLTMWIQPITEGTGAQLAYVTDTCVVNKIHNEGTWPVRRTCGQT